MQDVVYHFRFADGSVQSLATADAAATADGDPDGLPEWTRLGVHQCPNCPLDAARTPHCPMALQFVQLVQTASKLRSYEQVTVRVDTPQRSIVKHSTVQQAAGALMGLLAARSACPHMAFLKPMAHFHLPFATEEETIYRVASSYLLSQYFRQQQGETPDWALDGLKARYQELQHVNAAMARRLRVTMEQDGAINALILLDLLAKALPYSIDEQLDEIKALFAA